MKNKKIGDHFKKHLENFAYYINSMKDYKFGDTHITMLYFLKVSEYITYIAACLVIILSFIFTGKLLKKFYKHDNDKISILMRVRFIFGQILNISLTFILAGHVIRLIYSSNIQTIIFLVILIFVRELMSTELDKESHHIYKMYEAQLFFEEQRKKGKQTLEKQLTKDIEKNTAKELNKKD